MHKPAFEDALKDLAARKRRNLGKHPSPDDLLAYHVGRLQSDETEHVQDHLAVCGECAQLVLSLGPASEQTAQQALSVPSGKVASEWVRLQSRLSRGEGAAAPPVQPLYRQLRFAYSLAAALLIGVIGMSVWRVQIGTDAPSLISNTLSFELPMEDDRTRGGADELDVTHIPSGVANVRFVVPPFSFPDYSKYRVEVRKVTDAGEASILPGLFKDDLQKHENGELTFTLPSPLPVGSYRVNLYGLGSSRQDPIPLASYPVRVS